MLNLGSGFREFCSRGGGVLGDGKPQKIYFHMTARTSMLDSLVTILV